MAANSDPPRFTALPGSSDDSAADLLQRAATTNTPKGKSSPAYIQRVTLAIARGTFYVRVRARNAGGLGPPSNQLTVVIP